MPSFVTLEHWTVKVSSFRTNLEIANFNIEPGNLSIVVFLKVFKRFQIRVELIPPPLSK